MPRIAWMVACLAAGWPLAASAKTSPFTACDLHAAPHGKSDGREAPDLGHGAEIKALPVADRIQACTDALAAPELVPVFWARRIDLLEARVVLELAAKQRDRALADIDAAAVVGKPREGDRFYDRSAALGIEMIRAAALLDGPTLGDAQGRWAAISVARPFDLAIQAAAFRALSASGASFDLIAPVADRLQRLGGDAATMVIEGLLDIGRSGEAVRLYASLPEQPPEAAALGHTGDPPILQIVKRLATLERRLRIAYARAASGDADGARHELEAARTQGVVWAADVPVTGTWVKGLARYGVTRDRVTAQVDASMKAWRDLIDARVALDARRPVDLQTLMADPPRYVREELDILRAALATAPAVNGDALGRSELIRMRLAEYRTARLEPGLTYSQRPPAEARDNMTPFHASGGLMHGATGWKAEPQADGTITVTFTGYVPSHAIPEMAVLGAAAVARGAGKPAFVIDRSVGAAMTNVSTGMQSDQSAILTIRLLDAANTPRALRVVDVESGLQPVFEGVTGPT